MAPAYLDASAIVKLAIDEPESAALRRYLRRRRPLISSALARTEVVRALLDEGEEGIARGRAVLGRVELVRLNDRVLNAAGALQPPGLRSLDAIHVATALQLGDSVSRFITYDDKLSAAATASGLRVAAPK
jgi:predicted nucleic acid-binding protein